MGRKSLKKVRQKEIIKNFYAVAKIEGLENTSIAKVAKEMGINTSLILHYFESKEELIFGLIEYILDNYKSIYVTNINDSSKMKLIKTIDNLFSRDWNDFVDDGVFYSCYTLIFRDEKIKVAFKNLHDSLRLFLENIIVEAKKDHIITVSNPKKTAEIIFVLVEGAYYYLSLFDVTDPEYANNVAFYKKTAMGMLNFKVKPVDIEI